MNRTILKLLADRCRLAQGSMALVDKQLSEILSGLDNQLQKLYDEPIRGEEEHQTFFDVSSVPPLSAYEEE